MNEFIIANTEYVQFRNMSEDDQIAILKAKLNAPESVDVYIGMLFESCNPNSLAFQCAYRVRTIATPLVIPWELIAPDWQWAAMDAYKRIYFYTNEPHCESVRWDGDCIRVQSILDIDTTGIDWRRSKTRRPVSV